MLWFCHGTLPISEFMYSITAFRISKTSSICLQPLNGLIEPKHPLVFLFRRMSAIHLVLLTWFYPHNQQIQMMST